MKRILMCLSLSLAVLFIASSALASFFTFDIADMLAFNKTYDNPIGNATLVNKTESIVPPQPVAGVSYNFGLTKIGDESFSQMQVGYDKPIGVGGTLPPTYYNLTAFDTYEQYFYNLGPAGFLVNIYLNTGWTDPDWNHTDQYHENTWTYVAPNQSVKLVLDLTSLGIIESGGIGLGDDRRNWVSGIGFNFAYDFPEDSTSINGKIVASPVPLPGAVWLLGAGLVGLVGVRRKFVK